MITLLRWDEEGERFLSITATSPRASSLHVLTAAGGGAFVKREVCAEHPGDVRGAAWAPCELSGGLFAVACGDGRVYLWEQRLGTWGPAASERAAAGGGAGSLLPGAKSSAATALDFAPPHVGLQLAVGGGDGVVRVLACEDADEPTREGAWATREELAAGAGAVAAVAWCRAPGGAAMLATAAAAAAPVPAARGGGSHAPLTPAGAVLVWARTADAPPARPPRWVALLRLEGHAGPVRGLSWAPAAGRPAQMLASLGEWVGRGEPALCLWAVAPAGEPRGAAGGRGAAARERAVAYLAEAGLRGAVQLPGATVGAALVAVNTAPRGSTQVEWDGSGVTVACGVDPEEGAVRVLRENLAGDWADD
jgi:hypothetical protein